ncbi:MAG: helix-turn-helix domain-containing protein [Spirochaetales bacterium]|jgi:transcriptional regulator with XRE-family HTH domain|nr:helix-turn-helix domain-containing protein [Spirochaetales bacterium]
MTHFQELFVRNVRFFRKKKGFSQLKFSELINISPNYLNAVENGKNFPSPEVIQCISDILGIMPYQLFMEYPAETGNFEKGQELIRELTGIKQYFVKEIDEIIRKYMQLGC